MSSQENEIPGQMFFSCSPTQSSLTRSAFDMVKISDSDELSCQTIDVACGRMRSMKLLGCYA